MQTSLAVTVPIDSIRQFCQREATGELTWRTAAFGATVVLKGGRVAWATSTHSPFSLSRELERRVSGPRPSMREVFQSARSERMSLANALVDRQLMSAESLRDALRLQITAAIGTLNTEQAGTPHFVARTPEAIAYPDHMMFDLEEVYAIAEDATTLRKAKSTFEEEAGNTGIQRKQTRVVSLRDTLAKMMEIDGAVGCCAVDSNSGMMLGSAGGGGVNLEVAAAGNTEVVRAKRKTMRALGTDDSIDDMLITLGKQYHIIKPVTSNDALFLYLVLDKQRGNLAMARHLLSSFERDLAI